MTHKAQGFTLDDFPNIKRWYADVRARPKVQAGLAIGKFVKEPFDEEARRNMFGKAAKEMAGGKKSPSFRGVRTTSPEAITTVVSMGSWPAPSGASRHDARGRGTSHSIQ